MYCIAFYTEFTELYLKINNTQIKGWMQKHVSILHKQKHTFLMNEKCLLECVCSQHLQCIVGSWYVGTLDYVPVLNKYHRITFIDRSHGERVYTGAVKHEPSVRFNTENGFVRKVFQLSRDIFNGAYLAGKWVWCGVGVGFLLVFWNIPRHFCPFFVVVFAIYKPLIFSPWWRHSGHCFMSIL